MTAALVVLAIVVFLVLLFALSAIKVAREYERGIVFRLGRLLPQPKGPGLLSSSRSSTGWSGSTCARSR